MTSARRYSDSVTLPDAHDPALERGRLCLVIATIVINVIAVSLLDVRAVVGLAHRRGS